MHRKKRVNGEWIRGIRCDHPRLGVEEGNRWIRPTFLARRPECAAAIGNINNHERAGEQCRNQKARPTTENQEKQNVPKAEIEGCEHIMV